MTRAICLSACVRKKPVAVEVGDEKIVLFRNSVGQVQALKDLCPHMHVSLSLGKVVGDNLQCAYHGIEFSGDGRCAHVPSALGPLPNTKAVSYSVREDRGIIFLMDEEQVKPAAEIQSSFVACKVAEPDLADFKAKVFAGVLVEEFKTNYGLVYVRLSSISAWAPLVLLAQRFKLGRKHCAQ